MSTLNVTRALVTQTNPTEAQFDTMRTYLLTFFNTPNLDESNIATGSMLYTKLGDLGDDATLKFTSDDGIIGYNSSSDYFAVQNTEGDVTFGVYSGSLTQKLTLQDDGNLKIGGRLITNDGQHAQDADIMWLLARYMKPRLTYTSSDVVTCADNTGVAGSPIVMVQSQLLAVYDVTMSLAATANGYASGHTSTAVSGLISGESRTANRWYFVYAVKVIGGTQADGTKCVLVATVTPPITSNITSLNSSFTAGNWVYMGCIRNGYNDGTNTNVIVPFDMDESGWVGFRDTTVNGEGKGVTLASSSDTSDLEYTIVIANNAAATMPTVASSINVGGHREQDGFELHYRSTDTDENLAITGGCYHNGTIAALAPVVYLEVPLLTSFKFVVVGGSLSTDKRITLAGFRDHYV